MFVSFEGVDWSGKSTQAELLAEWLRSEGRTVVATREPGGTTVAEGVRELVLHGAHMAPWAEAALYAAARGDHAAQVIRPALGRGEDVVCDRYLDSSIAYQGSGRVLGADDVRRLSLWAAEGLLPDLTVLLDLDHEVARGRLDADDKPFDRLEAEQAEFHERVREAFLGLAAAEPERFLVLDASASPGELAAAVRDRIETLLTSGV